MQDEANIRGGFYGSLAPGERPALLIIDFQRGFTEPGLSPLASDCDTAIAATNRLIAAMRARKAPVLFTIVGYQPNLSDAGNWLRKCPSLATQIQGGPCCEIDPRLHYDAASDVVLHKTQASAFFGTSITGVLAAHRIDTLVIAGATTSGCVRASAVDAMQYGYLPFVVRDCVADRSQQQHEANLVDMASKYAEVVTLEDMLGLLNAVRPH
ncbi:MAG: isochorismatase family protein [Castellaniella sp.]